MKYFFVFLTAIALIVGVFLLVLRGFSGGGEPKNQINLLDYTTSDTVMQLTVDGPVNANSIHQAYRITVSRNDATIEMMEGYDGRVTSTKTYESTEQAYANFLRSLQLLGYTKGNTDPTKADERGQCPTGQRYVYEIIGRNQRIERFWSTSCGGGTYGGNANQTRLLFTRQIPDFFQITKNFRK